MKTNKIVLFFACIAMYACSDMNDLSDKFFERGETVYAATVDALECRAGHNRILIALTIKTQKIETVRVYWNNNQDSTDVHIGSKSGYYTAILENMPENSYLFTLISFDKKGNRSLVTEVEGYSVDSVYLANSVSRKIANATRDMARTGTITWYTKMSEDLVYSEVKYKTPSGDFRVERIDADSPTLACPDIKPGEIFEYRSVFLPANGVDSLAGEWQSYNTPFIYQYPRTGWTADARSSHNVGGWDPPASMFDGLANTGWNSLAPSPLPQCFVVDMQESLPIHHIELMRDPGNTFYKDIEVYLSETPITPDVYQPAWGAPAVAVEITSNERVCPIYLPSGSAGRYIVCYFPTSNLDTYIYCREFNVFGY
ncbi:hypothetical protein SAMD00024442_115_4 [Candidatus Symbiothrix dinenymphae]|nr:hypothetical protein SAMD00024442_115_4 [Candidatus Symbiothrix dinenymphae]